MVLSIRFAYFLMVAIVVIMTSTACEKHLADHPDDDNNITSALSLNSPCKYDITLFDKTFHHNSEEGLRTCIVGSKGSVDPETGMGKSIPAAGLVDTDLGYGLDISKGTLHFNTAKSAIPSNEQFAALFAEGEYSFSKEAADGFQLVFLDNSGVEWSTSKGDALSNSNWLRIEESVSGELENIFHVAIKASFSCGMANDAGEIRTCSGSFTMQFENF